ncbi:MAG: hypothetical protein GC152_01950 [Alphaproteobacteria bacterium]|nr:hypothetical protein [Alphaproteobacteria bacterium]
MADGAPFSGLKRPKIAFTGEEFGFGYQAVKTFRAGFKDSARRILLDAGAAAVSDGKVSTKWLLRGRRDDETKKTNGGFDLTQPEERPLFSKEQALVAVKSKTVDMAIVPFYAPYTGYDIETLNTLSSLFALTGVQQISATDQLCLAVYEPQLLDVVQTSHPGSGLSALLGAKRNRWQSNAWTEEMAGAGGENSRQYGGGVNLDSSAQYMLRERIDSVFAGPEAVRRCKSKLDGLRAAGVDVRETLNSVEPHREMARLARSTLNNSRQTSTSFDPRGGGTMFTSIMAAENPNAKLYGVVMPFEIAYQSPDFVIIDPNIEDADPGDRAVKTRFMVVREVIDESLLDDTLGLTGNRSRYWMRRLNATLEDAEAMGGKGVRVMLRFNRSKKAASIGDVEGVLRHHGIRHAVVKIVEDSGKENPGAILLDIEFEAKHFRSGLPLVGRSAVRDALGYAFARWRGRSTIVAAAMPFDEHQLPEAGRRTFVSDNVVEGYKSFVRDKWIRYRVPIAGVVGAAAAAFFFNGEVPPQVQDLWTQFLSVIGAGPSN